MGDLFDEFKRELERRRSATEGSEPVTDDETPTPVDDADETNDTGDNDADDADAADGEEPIPLRRRSDGRGTPPRNPRTGRPVGGADDGAQPPSIGTLIRRAGLTAVIIAVVAVVLLAGAGVNLWTDAIWYTSVGFDQVFWTRIGSQGVLFGAGLLGALIVLLGNLWLAGRLTPPADPERPGRIRQMADRLAEAQRQAERQGQGRNAFGFGIDDDRSIRSRAPGARPDGGGATALFETGELPNLLPLASWAIAGVVILVALGFAGALSGGWQTIQLWVHRVPFSTGAVVTDPVFGKDISFFLFELPFWRLVQSMLNGVLVASLAVAGARYFVAAANGGEVFITRVRVHLALIAGLYLLSVAFGYQLDKYELVYSQGSGVLAGVAYADAHARFMAYDVLTFLSGIAGALLVGGAFTRWMWPLGLVVGVWFAASVVLGGIYPDLVQRFSVDPDRYGQEQPYIANNIAMTRLAYGLEDWTTQPYAGGATLSAADIAAEADTFANARLWDYRPLQTTLDNLQTIKQYYNFTDVDTDRYPIAGKLRQVMLSGRELAIEKNSDATGWVNQRISYTHGIGIAMVPVNEVTPEGQPRLWVRDLPPISSNGAPSITEPRIYFGETDNHYVVVRARQAEFDFPGGGANGADTTTNWSGNTGVQLSSTLSRLLFATRFRDLDLLISNQITSDSQLLFHRTLSERLGLIAPFLAFDKDPYLVVDGSGRLVFVQDAYTVSNRFPGSTPFDTNELGGTSGLAGTDLNYIRNSVKITMDAYDGTMHFYVSDPTDPIIRAWEGIFPALFESMDGLPVGLATHLRVPEELFNVQTRVYGQYHVTQTLTFFNNNDRWTVPADTANEQSLPSEAYYTVMRMPGESAAEFLLLQPMIAASRPNMMAWVAARNDTPNYGTVRVYQFPSDTTVFGPAQIEARIDQNPTISAQITLWNTSGSAVKRGNLIVIPVGNSLLYLQPVYLQSTSAAFPEFQKIVVASPTTVVWGSTLKEALDALLAASAANGGGTVTPTPTPGPGATATPGPGPTATPGTSPVPGDMPGDVDGLVAYANAHFEAAQAALHNSDFATYGAEMNKVQAALAKLAQLTGVAGASANP